MHAFASVLCDDAVCMQCIYTCVLIVKSGLKRGRRELGLALLEQCLPGMSLAKSQQKKKRKINKEQWSELMHKPCRVRRLYFVNLD